jgi:imidazolonepropionase-like amidohydrolase
MRGLYNQQKKIYIHVNAARYISEAIQFCQKHGLKPVIVGGNESYIIADFLKKNDISVILMNIHRLPEKTSDPMDLPYKIPSLLKQAGVRFCIGVRGSWEVRNLAFQAGTTAGYGLTKEEALKTITLDAAKILGVDKLYGSLENGKAAQFFISKGDALDMDGNQVVYAFSNGNPVDLKGQQQELFEKYHKKYFKK